MKASELRIGNKILFNGIVDVVAEVSNAGHILAEINGFGNLDKGYIDPIPLTEEWLIKIGFEGYDNPNMTKSKVFYINGVRLLVSHNEITLRDFYDKNPIVYVHQLQNIYFALKRRRTKWHLKQKQKNSSKCTSDKYRCLMLNTVKISYGSGMMEESYLKYQ
ncbi:MAG TPA: hypothetical protein VFF27_00090 [Bacteroidia bacterium]|jgi:hypothetical protein|nr:hypothetical protein [Bacteroidia bacterium]